VTSEATATILAAIIGVLSGAISGTIGSLFVLLYGRSLRFRGEIKGKVTLFPLWMGAAPGSRTFWLDLFNEKDVGVALREFALVFHPPDFPSKGSRSIFTFVRDQETGKIMEPVVLAPQEAIRKSMVISANDALQDDPGGPPWPYAEKGVLEAFAASKKSGCIAGIFPTSNTIGR
jgi:hypothetical protein